MKIDWKSVGKAILIGIIGGVVGTVVGYIAANVVIIGLFYLGATASVQLACGIIVYYVVGGYVSYKATELLCNPMVIMAAE